MTTVGSYEAKTHLSQLLLRVGRGETIVITKRGQPIALLTQPDEKIIEDNVHDVIQQMNRYAKNRRGKRLSVAEIKKMTHEGHRY